MPLDDQQKAKLKVNFDTMAQLIANFRREAISIKQTVSSSTLLSEPNDIVEDDQEVKTTFELK